MSVEQRSAAPDGFADFSRCRFRRAVPLWTAVQWAWIKRI